MGQNVAAIVGWALAMLSACEPGFGEVTAQPAAALGLAMGAATRAGRDKLTLLLPKALEPFGLWVEQLVAESTGKEGVGRDSDRRRAARPARRSTDRTASSCACACTARMPKRCATPMCAI